jgi:hypothetical protein
VRNFLAVVGLLTLLYLGLCWVGEMPPTHGRDVLVLFFEACANVVRHGAVGG